MTKEQLFMLQEEKISRVERVDIEIVVIDQTTPAYQRAEAYLRQIKNPYAFKCGTIAVNVGFSSGGKTLREALTSCFAAGNNDV